MVFGPIMRVDLLAHLREAFVHFYEKDHATQAVETMNGFVVGGELGS